MSDDLQLIQQYASSGDAEALSAVCQRYQGMVYSVCLRLHRDPHAAEDSAQECFLTLIKNADRVRSSLGGWLHRSATHVCLKALHRGKARDVREKEYAEMSAAEDAVPWEEVSPHVDEALDALPDELRHAVIEHFLRQRTQADIAEELGVSAATVSRRVDKGLEELRERLKKAGVTLSVALLGTFMSDKMAVAAPATLSAELGKMVIAGVGSAAGGTAAAAGGNLLASAAGKAALGVAAVVIAVVAILAYKTRPKPAQPARQPARAAAPVPAEMPEAPPDPNSKGEARMLTIALAEGLQVDVVKIDPGAFLMGPENGGEEEKPVHKVTIPRPFFLGVYEVTQEQWEAVMGTNPSQFRDASHPVEQVTWAECQTFLQRLSGMTTEWDFRLLTEAEWEYACRAGTTTEFFFGETDSALGEYAWYGVNSGGRTHPVGQKKANPWGLFDVYGNVWEWVQDRDHANYDGAPDDGSAWESTGGRHHIVRGGSWDDPAKFCRSSSRPQYYPAEKSLRYGFRIACTQRTQGEKAMREVDYSQLVLKGDRCKQDTFSLTVQAAARLLGIEADYETIYALSTNAFTPDIRPDEPCRCSWCVQGRERALDLVADYLGLKVRLLPWLDRTRIPDSPDTEVERQAWFAEHYRKPRVPLVHEAMANGEVIITDREWQPHSAFWCDWGIITSADDDGTILGATVDGSNKQILFLGGYARALSVGEKKLSEQEMAVAALRLAVDRIRGRGRFAPNRQIEHRPKVVFGLDALDAWIESMSRVPFTGDADPGSVSSKKHASCTAYPTSGGAKVAASFLRSQAESLPEGSCPHLEMAAAHYDRIVQLLHPALTGEGGETYEQFMGDLAKQQAHVENVLKPVKAALAAAADAMEKALAVVRTRREGDKVWLDGLRSTGLHTRLMASIEGCLRYLGCKESAAWIYGASGHAFIIAASKKPDICDYHFWHPHPVLELVGNLGYEIDCTFGWVDDPDFADTQAKAWEKIRAAIDRGLPCFGFNIVMPPQYQLIIGYDSNGYYSERAPDKAVQWQDVKAFPGDLAMCSVAPGQRKDDRSVVRGALERALELAGRGNDNWGQGAYGRWLSSVETGTIKDAMGVPYLVRVWAECRSHAVAFLREAEARLGDGVPAGTFTEAVASYDRVAAAWGKLAKVVPEGGEAWGAFIADPANREELGRQLQTAREAEAQGLAALANIVKALAAE